VQIQFLIVHSSRIEGKTFYVYVYVRTTSMYSCLAFNNLQGVPIVWAWFTYQ
jgi:hypothetical protein